MEFSCQQQLPILVMQARSMCMICDHIPSFELAHIRDGRLAILNDLAEEKSKRAQTHFTFALWKLPIQDPFEAHSRPVREAACKLSIDDFILRGLSRS